MSWLPNCLLSSEALVVKARESIARRQFDKAVLAAQKVIDRLGGGKARSPDQRRQLDSAWLHKGQAERELGHDDLAESALLNAARTMDLPDADLLWILDRALRRGDWSEDVRTLGVHLLARHEASSSAMGQAILHSMESTAGEISRTYPIDDAIQWHEQAAAAAGGTAWLHAGLGRLLCEKKLFAEAVPSLRTAVELMPNEEEAGLRLALACTEMGDHAAALNELEAIRRDPASPCAALLLAHVLRRLGRFEDAAEAFAYARMHGAKFVETDDLADAEALANTGQWVAVSELVAKHQASRRTVWRWLACAAHAALDQYDEAVTAASRLTTEDLAASEPLRICVFDIVAKTSDAMGSLQLLNCFPSKHRTPPWHGLSGSLYCASDQWPEALEVWMKLPPEPRAALIAGVIQEQAGQAVPAWLNGARELNDEVLSDADVGGALATYLREGAAELVSAEARDTAMDFLDRLAAVRTPLETAVRLRRAQVAEATREWLVLSDELDRIERGIPAIELLRARTSIAGNDIAGAEAALALLRDQASSLPEPQQQTMTMLDAAIAIRRGDWSSALALLSRGPQEQEMALLHVLTRLRARANVGAEHVANLPGKLGVVLMAWSRALRGQIDLDELASTVTEDGVRAEAAPLRGWLRLQEAHRMGSGSDPALGIAALQEVGQLWPDISELLDEEDWQAQLLMLLPVRPVEARELIDGSNTVVGDPATCHRIALCWLSEAARHWDAREWRAAVTALERSLAHWAVALCDERWVQSWLDTRAQVWQRSADFDAAADLRARFVKYVERLATLWSAELVHSDAMLAESLQLAPMLWEAECHAARRIAELGGLPLEDGRKIIAGPGYLHEKNLEEVFQSFVSDVQIPGEWSDDMREIMRLLDMSASEFGESPETESSRKDLRLRFSPMRVACALERNGEIERAIARLRGVLSLPCVSIDDEDWTLEHTDVGFDSMSDEEEYATAAGNLLVEWLVKKGEQAVAKGGDALKDGMEAWREAILLADEKDADGDNVPRQRIPRSIMGRCDVLAKAKRLEEGRELLERGMELLPHDEHLRSMLANFYVNAGVDIANEKSDWDQSLVWLRKAHQLAPDLPRVMRNVALCLHMSAKAKLDSGKARAAAGMFKEAADIAMRCLRVDRNDEEMRNVHASSNNGYLEASMRDGGLTGIDNVLEALMTSNAGGQRTLSTKYHNEAVQKANAGRWREAIELFEKALIYEPDSEATKKMLAQSLMGQINELMGRLAPVEEILPLVRRAASLDPRNPFIRLLDSTL